MESIRAVSESSHILPASLIPRYGFGQQRLTRRTGINAVGSKSVLLEYRLPCTCVVSQKSEIGGVCVFCRDELEQRQQQGTLDSCLTPTELDWCATPCDRHYWSCSFPFCPRGGCAAHFAHARDGKPYCAPHFREVERAFSFEAIGQRHGVVVRKIAESFSSLFRFDDVK